MQNPALWKSDEQPPNQEVAPLTDSAPHHGPFFVIINTSSGAGGDRRQTLLNEYFSDAGVQAHIIPIDARQAVEATVEQATEQAHEAQGTLVVAGGDGTINTALPYLLERDIPLGILPSGTFNYVAREFGIPLDLRQAVETLATGRQTEVPVGQVNGRPFLVNASLGLYPRLLEDREHFKRKYGRNRVFALAAAAGSLVTRHARSFSLEVKRAREQGPLGAPHQLEIATLFIGNNALQLERVGIEAEASADVMTAIALRTPSPLRLVELGVRAALGKLGDAKDVLSFSFEKLIAQEWTAGESRVKIALDGEVTHMKGPLVFERAPQKLRLIIPADRASLPIQH